MFDGPVHALDGCKRATSPCSLVSRLLTKSVYCAAQRKHLVYRLHMWSFALPLQWSAHFPPHSQQALSKRVCCSEWPAFKLVPSHQAPLHSCTTSTADLTQMLQLSGQVVPRMALLRRQEALTQQDTAQATVLVSQAEQAEPFAPQAAQAG